MVNFEYSRPESGSTSLSRDEDEQKILYRHPDLQDSTDSPSAKIHDLYALGVVLLEIAIWETAHSIRQRAQRASGQSGQIGLNAKGLQKLYVSTANKKIAHFMGDSYLSVVLACLDTKYRDQTSRTDFTRIFNNEVIQKLSVKSLDFSSSSDQV